MWIVPGLQGETPDTDPVLADEVRALIEESADTKFAIPKEPVRPTLKLTIGEAVTLSLKSNLDLAIKKFAPKLAEYSITKEEAAFDPTSKVALEGNRSKSQSESGDSLGQAFGASSGLSKKFKTGTELSLDYELEDTLEPPAGDRYKSGVTLKLSQNLLKGFGIEINRAAITLAELAADEARANVFEQALNTVSEIQKTYWDLYNNVESLTVRRESYQLARDFYEKKRTQAQIGGLAPLDLIEIDADVASKISDYLEAFKNIRTTEVKLKTLLDMPLDFEGKPLSILPVSEPGFIETSFDFEKSFKMARRLRPEYLKLRLKKRSKELELRLSRNSARPDLKLVGSMGFTNLEDTRVQGILPFDRGDRNKFDLGVELSYPLGNRAAKAELWIKELELRQLIAEIVKQDLNTKREIADGILTVESNANIVKFNLRSLQLQERDLKASELRLKFGQSSTRDFLDAQKRLTDARLKYITSQAGYQQALVEMYKSRGHSDPALNTKLFEDYWLKKNSEE